MLNNDDLFNLKFDLLTSFKLFTQTFYKIRTGKDFIISNPAGRESHHLILFRALTKLFKGETKRLLINTPPRYHKTETFIHFVPWALAHYPDSNFLYISSTRGLAEKATQTIRSIIELPEYYNLFDVRISDYSSAKYNFETNKGGTVYAVGAGGTITGRGAGILGVKRFGGCMIIDDIHKAQEVYSDVIRTSENNFYHHTLKSRLNDPENTPIAINGQRLHEDDLAGNIIKGADGPWEKIILKALDDNGYALWPQMHSREKLLEMKNSRKDHYVFHSQYQQDPIPPGGCLYRKEDFSILIDEPKMQFTFITGDTAETDKTYNDSTVFSFWGVYKRENRGIQDDNVYLHWLDCFEERCEPKDLLNRFLQFYSKCMSYEVQPSLVAIEKKSTGVSLISYLNELRGIRVLEIERTAASGSKVSRFINAQYYIGSRLLSFTHGMPHTDACIDHMTKITDNNTHAHDDICDTCVDAIKIGIIDDLFRLKSSKNQTYEKMIKSNIMINLNYSKNLNSIWKG